MRAVEIYLRDPENHLFLAEDGRGLFVWCRHSTDTVNKALEDLRNGPRIKWFRDFSNQREDSPERGAREAVADIFQEIRERNLDLSPHLSDILNEEVGEKFMEIEEDASPSH